ncbi:MAG: LemA family protein [Ghiorsea sp.]|nr:LemA family protein [Ghiorsea sp.]MDQ7057005.1 LemA family protein [Ghiorsea sp.]
MTLGTFVLIFFGIFIFLIVWIVVIYNRLVSYKNIFKNDFSQIDVQLNRRYDLIPNIVEAAKAYLTHEKETLDAVISARNAAASAMKAAKRDPSNTQAMQSLIATESALGGAMLNFNALTEAYPDLKANETIAQLQEELTSTENRIAFARQRYNDDVMNYNTQRQLFPDVLIANMFNFAEAIYFELSNPKQAKPVRISF